MRDHPHGDHRHPDIWTGRATNRVQWLAALAGAACLALGIELAVDSAWESGVAALAMSVVGCIAAGLLILYGTLAFVHVAVKVDGECLEVRCGHIGVPRRRIPLSHVAGAEFAPRVTPRRWRTRRTEPGRTARDRSGGPRRPRPALTGPRAPERPRPPRLPRRPHFRRRPAAGPSPCPPAPPPPR
ncbi:hypothetical protein B0E37_06273 [Streptomyces sp. MH192]|nr:hypothetical protein [Streptomyces sp. MH192]